MANIVIASVAFWANAKLILVGDCGKPEVVEFKARFKRLKTSERKTLEASLHEKTVSDAEFLDTVLVDWDLKDRQGNNVTYTENARAEMVEDWDGLEAALVTSYFENARLSREAAAIAKNSEAPSATT